MFDKKREAFETKNGNKKREAFFVSIFCFKSTFLYLFFIFSLSLLVEKIKKR